MKSHELRQLRTELGITQETMGLLLGISRANYVRLETSRDPTIQQAHAAQLIALLHANGLLDEAISAARRGSTDAR